MKSLIKFITAFTLIYQTCNAQELVTKGTPAKFDSTVVMPLTTYRLIRVKVSTADTYIVNLKKTIDSLNSQISLQNELAAKLVAISQKQSEFNEQSQKSFNELSEKFDNLHTETTKPKKWWERDSFQIGAAFILALLIAK